jgi:tetratricopeptide (TPR) repeat protein
MSRWSRIGSTIPFAVALVGLLAYRHSLTGSFIFDDATAITGNRNIGQLFPIVFSTRWVVDLSFRLNYALGGFNPTDFRAVNLAIHIAAALLLFGIIRRTLMLPRFGKRFSRTSTWLAGATALFFVAHPLQTASVTYICQRYEAMMALCFLATLYAFVRAFTTDSRAGRMLWAAASVLACLLGMGTKEVMLAAPLVALVYDWIFIGGSLPSTRRLRVGLHAGLLLTLVGLAVMEMRLLAIMAEAGQGITGSASPWIYLATQTEVILHYLRLSVWPSGQCLDYAWPLVSGWGDVWAAALGIIGLGVATLYGLVKRSSWGFLGAFFFLVLAPSSSLMPAPDAAFEHRMYLPLTAVLTAIVLGGYLLLRPLAARTRRPLLVWVIIAAALTGALAMTTHQRNNAYTSNQTMWRDLLAKQPGNYRQRLALFYALFGRGNDPEAEIVIRDLMADTKAGFDRKASSDTPGRDPFFYHALACGQLGRLILHSGDAAGAIEHITVAIRALPEHAAAHNNMALALGVLGRYEEAMLAARAAIRLNRGSSRGYVTLALLLVHQGDFAAAAEHYRQAMELSPPPHLAMNLLLGWLLATAPDASLRDGAEAERLSMAALAATHERSIRGLDVLAAALAEQGRFDEALTRLDQALSLTAPAPTSEDGDDEASVPDGLSGWGPSADRTTLLERRARYEKRMPYRAAPLSLKP